jgi:hypothetical protein
MMMLSESRERLLKDVLSVVQGDSITEVHFFQPIRQGGMESGVAVIAAREDAGDPERHAVYTARYRHTLKGPDRGKWESNVVAEADAPLLTVDAVVRGVQRRSGDAEEPTRVSGTELVAVLDRVSPAVPPVESDGETTPGESR